MRGPDIAAELCHRPRSWMVESLTPARAADVAAPNRKLWPAYWWSLVREAQRSHYPTDFRNELLLQERAIRGFQVSGRMGPAGFLESTRSPELRPPGKGCLAEDDVHTSAELVSLGLAEAEPEHLRFQGVCRRPCHPTRGAARSWSQTAKKPVQQTAHSIIYSPFGVC